MFKRDWFTEYAEIEVLCGFQDISAVIWRLTPLRKSREFYVKKGRP
jgi:hypothetical protein